MIRSLKKMLAWGACAVLLALGGCVGDNPDYCENNAQCQDPNREGYDAAKKYCHKDGKFCHVGCTSDDQCKIKTARNEAWYDPSRPYCDKASYSCVAKKTSDGGVDAGADCCFDVGVDAADSGAPDLKDIGADGAINGTKCNVDGVVCASGKCVDGYCCNSDCKGTCEACNVAGKLGTCSDIPAGTDPDGECKGDKECGGDMCFGSGNKCTAAKNTGTVCKESCDTNLEKLEQTACDASHKCVTVKTPVDCNAYKCIKGSGSTKDACAKTCVTHDQCEKDGACDRSQAHTSTGGVCLASTKVTSAKDATALTTALAAAGSTAKYILLSGTTAYSGNFTLKSGKAMVMGAGKTKLAAKDLLKPVVLVDPGAELALQGVAVSGSNKDGIKCDATSTKPGAIKVLESQVEKNLGIGITTSNCDAELRRNRISTNGKGGVKLQEGTFTIVNNVVDNNGADGSSSGSTFGGLNITPASGKTFVFYNNTVADNLAKTTGASGIYCGLNTGTLYNTIVYSKYNTTKAATTTGCTFSHSNVQGSKGTGTNKDEDPKFTSTFSLTAATSKCIDAGTSTNIPTIIDILNNPRPDTTGLKKVDMGAYEVK